MSNILRAIVLANAVKTLPFGPHTESEVVFNGMIIVLKRIPEEINYGNENAIFFQNSLSLIQENLRQADDKDGTLARSFKCRVNLTFTVFTVQAGEL